MTEEDASDHVKTKADAAGEVDKQGTTEKYEKYEDVAIVSENKDTTQTIASIDVNIPQVEKDDNDADKEQSDENKDNNDRDADADDDDESQSVVMGTTKSVTFSIHHNQDDVDEEIARVTLNKASDDQMSNFDVEVDFDGRAQTTNTPVTVITEYPEDGRKR